MTKAERSTMIDSWKNLGFAVSDKTDRATDDAIVYLDLPETAPSWTNQVSGYVSDKSIAEGKVKFEFRMPVPRSDEEAKEFYGCDLDLIIRTGILGFSRSADDKAKPVLFDGSQPSVEKHLAMQDKFSSWRPGVRERTAVAPKTKLEKALKTDEGYRNTILLLIESERITLGQGNDLLAANELAPFAPEDCKRYRL